MLYNISNFLQSAALIKAALENHDLSSDDDVRPDRGSADEDEESVDEDFHADSDSDVAEEYDSAHESSGGSGSDAEMDDADDDDAVDDEMDDEEEEDRPKKKSKV